MRKRTTNAGAVRPSTRGPEYNVPLTQKETAKFMRIWQGHGTIDLKVEGDNALPGATWGVGEYETRVGIGGLLPRPGGIAIVYHPARRTLTVYRWDKVDHAMSWKAIFEQNIDEMITLSKLS